MTDKEIIKEIYRAIYKEIGVDYDKVKKEENWFSNYFLAQDKQDEIVENILRGKKLTKIKKNAIKSTVWLGESPVG